MPGNSRPGVSMEIDAPMGNPHREILPPFVATSCVVEEVLVWGVKTPYHLQDDAVYSGVPSSTGRFVQDEFLFNANSHRRIRWHIVVLDIVADISPQGDDTFMEYEFHVIASTQGLRRVPFIIRRSDIGPSHHISAVKGDCST